MKDKNEILLSEYYGITLTRVKLEYYIQWIIFGNYQLHKSFILITNILYKNHTPFDSIPSEVRCYITTWSFAWMMNFRIEDRNWMIDIGINFFTGVLEIFEVMWDEFRYKWIMCHICVALCFDEPCSNLFQMTRI